MQTFKVIGVKQSNFKPQDSDKEVRGYNLYLAYEQKGVVGTACERVYVKESALESSGVPAPGMEIGLSYNRWGKVDFVEVLSEVK